MVDKATKSNHPSIAHLCQNRRDTVAPHFTTPALLCILITLILWAADSGALALVGGMWNSLSLIVTMRNWLQNLATTQLSWARSSTRSVAPGVFWYTIFSLIGTANAVNPRFDNIILFSHTMDSTFQLATFLVPWLLLLTMTLLLVVAIYAFLQSTKKRIPRQQDSSCVNHLRSLAEDLNGVCTSDVPEPWQDFVLDPERDPPTFVTTCIIVPLMSLVLVGGNLSNSLRYPILVLGPAIIFGCSPPPVFHLHNHIWWVVFLLAGSLMTFGTVCTVRYTRFGLDWYQAQALLPWTCAAFALVSHLLMMLSKYWRSRVGASMHFGPIRAVQGRIPIGALADFIQEQRAILADTQSQRRTQPPSTPQVLQAHSQFNGRHLRPPAGQRLGNRAAFGRTIDQLTFGFTRYAAGQR